MTTLSPRVSVVLPVYNAGEPLRRAVDSIVAQTYTDWELVAVDDGSTDGSGAVLDDYARRDPRIRVIHQENQRQVAAMNRAIGEARGEFVARMDADDRSYPERFARQVAYLDAHPEVGVLGTLADVAFPDGERIWGGDESHVLLCWRLLFTTPMVHPSIMMRTAVVRAAGGYAPEADRLEDYELFERLSHTTRLATLPERLVWYDRSLDTNISTVYRDVQQQVAQHVHARLFRHYGLDVAGPLLEDYSQVAFEGPEIVQERGWSAARIGRVAVVLRKLTDRFVERVDPPRAEREEIWGRTLRLLYSLEKAHARASGRPVWSKVARIGWAPRLFLWNRYGLAA